MPSPGDDISGRRQPNRLVMRNDADIYTMIRDHIYGRPNPYLLPYSETVCRAYNSHQAVDQPRVHLIRIIMVRRDTVLRGIQEHD
jgi:hypothetical protein